jgi:hypothetical protein
MGAAFAAIGLAGAACVGEIGDARSGATPGAASSPDDPGVVTSSCRVTTPKRAPLRRLTRFEYDNTLRDLFSDPSWPSAPLPAEEVGNGFGNDSDALSVSTLLAEQYGRAAEATALRATAPERFGKLVPCAASSDPKACARTFLEDFLPRAFRRSVTPAEVDEFLGLVEGVRATSDLRTAIAAALEAIFQSPEFLYRVEFGEPDDAGAIRPTGDEMATRLSYLFWATTPDDTLRAAARAGELSNAEGIAKHAARMVDDPRARPVLRFFFDNVLPLSGLTDLERDKVQFPTFSAEIGRAMREETQRFLEDAIFEAKVSWPTILTADWTFVNEPLAKFYGMTGVTGPEFRKVSLDVTKRLGLLTHASILAGTTHSNATSPVVRGAFVAKKILCQKIPFPTGAIAEQITPPSPDRAPTARERYKQHSEDPVCVGCHKLMDPLGLALENYDPVGLYRDKENGATIDPSGGVPISGATAAGPIELVKRIAETKEASVCLATHWTSFALGRTLGEPEACTKAAVAEAFEQAGYDVRALLLAITKSSDFLYLPETRP